MKSKVTLAVTHRAALLLLLATLTPQLSTVFAQGTAFTYQGQLSDNGSSANGTYHLRFAVFDASSGGIQIGPTLTNTVVATSNGLFTVTLNFGANVFTGPSRWLEIAARTNGSTAAFTVLVTRQPLLPTPYAIAAGTVPNSAINASMLANGSVTATKIASGAVTATALANNSVGSVQLADDLDLGSASVDGRLDVFRTTAGTVALRLDGSANSMFLYGEDGSEVGRFTGQTYGLIELRDSDGHQIAARLNANDNNGGRLSLFNSNGVGQVLLQGEVGGALTLYNADSSGIGALLDAYDSTGAGRLELRNTNAALGALIQGGPAAGSLTLYDSNSLSGASLKGIAGGELSLSRAILDGKDSFGAGRLTLYESGGYAGATLMAEDGTGGEAVLSLSKYGGSGIFGRPASRAAAGYLWLWNTQNLLPSVKIQASQDSEGDGTGGYILMYSGDGTVNTVEIDAERGAAGGGYLGLRNGNGKATIELDGDNGIVKGQVVQITGGSDFSENFDISGAAHEPGMIVSIDPANPGRLVLSTSAYDKKVAGIISGAGGVRPGMLMGQGGSIADGKHPVALTGRVYCWVDADASGAIEPGDMVTTSNSAGHGMKVTDATRATGAIIGKAMTSLDQGKGLVLVLVSLQ